ncbi:zinc ribbon domain-containing protein, partial [Thermus scotoductus]|uniref:zinc ribbon domain-containing protein n=1 Tax=Thermus scotoductus TaxID=37636 RepID=UPI00195F908A
AYSSQACSRCGYVDPRNRRDTQTFVCQACGHRGNAQVNAARNRSCKELCVRVCV